MEEIKPKKERKFLKAMGDIALTLVRELLLNVGKKVINKSGNKRQGLVLAFIVLASTFAVAQYPTTGNKQRLGYQTTGDGLVFRGRASDTTALKPSTINNAYHLFDTLNNVLFSYIKTKGGWKFNNSDTVIIQGVTMPFDSITFNTTKDGTVGVGEVEYNDSQGSLIQGLKGGNVTNVIGQQLHQLVNNRTGATLNKGDVVYLSGSQGNRITVAKAIATSDPTSANTFGIVAESIANNQSGYIITEGLIAGLNTSSLTQDSAVYLSGTTAGALTSTKPQAPIHGVYIGVCVKTNAGSGEVFVKIRNGQELDELHDVQISSPVNNASLYFKSNEGLWRDTTAALLTSDTSSMLTNYLRSGVAASTYLTQSNAASTYLPLAGGTVSGTINRQEGSNDGSASTFYYNILNYFAKRDNNKSGQTAQITFTDRPGTATFENNVRTSDIYLMTAKNLSGGQLGQYLDTTLSVVANQDGGRVGISKLNPAYKLDVNGTFNASGNSLIGGTLGVTGATTLSAPLTVNSSAVFNEGSTDSDFRVESDGNANMLFVDASTDRVGIGTSTPSKTLEVNGEVKINTTSVTPTVLLGKDANNVVGQLYIDGGLSIIGNNLFGINPSFTSTTSTSVIYASGYMNTVSSLYIKITQNSTVTITLPSATGNNGRLISIKNLGTGAVISNSSNVEPFNSSTLGTAILSSGGGKWANLVSDGTNWVIMSAN